MSKAKSGVPPPQDNREETGQKKRQRDDKGRFIKGNKNGGRPKLREEFKRFAQEKSYDALKVVWGIMVGEETNARDRLSAARILMEYGYGKPAAEFDRERLDLDRARFEREAQADQADKTIRVVMSDELRELAK